MKYYIYFLGLMLNVKITNSLLGVKDIYQNTNILINTCYLYCNKDYVLLNK